MLNIRASLPEKLEPLLKPARYKGLHGGRGGAKSHFFAEQLVIRCAISPTRWVCIREVQNSLKESVRQLLVSKIAKLGLGWAFDVLETEIRGKPGTPAFGSLIIFRGMQSYNAENIKSLEDYDGAWVEEAQSFSAVSLRLLRPTIRKPGSELWFSWNPRHDDDPVDALLRGPGQPPNSIVVEVNWQDNPWFPDVLREEKDLDYRVDPEMAEHVWGGGYLIITEGSYYAKQLFAAEKEGRIGWYPYDPSLPVDTAWDLGVDDYTAIWFLQQDGQNCTVVDYYETSNDGAEEIVSAALPELNPDESAQRSALIEAERDEPFRYGTHFTPHDVMQRKWGMGARSPYQTLMSLGVKPIIVGVQQAPMARINAVRQLLPITRFHNTKRVQKGVMRLRRYSRKKNDAMGTYGGPLHDENSHGADAFGEYAVNRAIFPARPVPAPLPKPKPGQVLLPQPPTAPSGVRIRI